MNNTSYITLTPSEITLIWINRGIRPIPESPIPTLNESRMILQIRIINNRSIDNITKLNCIIGEQNFKIIELEQNVSLCNFEIEQLKKNIIDHECTNSN